MPIEVYGDFAPIVAMMGGVMGKARELPPPADLPEGTKTIVKVQRPPDGRGDDLHWMVFARGPKHVRLCRSKQLPLWLLETVGSRRKAYFNAEVRNGVWVFLSVAQDQTW